MDHCPLLGICPLLGASINGESTVSMHRYLQFHRCSHNTSDTPMSKLTTVTSQNYKIAGNGLVYIAFSPSHTMIGEKKAREQGYNAKINGLQLFVSIVFMLQGGVCITAPPVVHFSSPVQ